MSVLLVALVVTGCAVNEKLVYVSYSCTVPDEPTLPFIDGGELWDRVGEEMYNSLSLREESIVGWAKEMEATLQYICNKKAP